MSEAIVRQRIEECVKALNARNLDGVMSIYAPSIVSFDLNPPLRYAGADVKRQAWQAVLAAFSDLAYEVRDLSVTASGALAFSFSLNHVTGTLANGQATDLWVRWTACFQRIDGEWLIVHDHVSVPADLEHGQAALHLTP